MRHVVPDAARDNPASIKRAGSFQETGIFVCKQSMLTEPFWVRIEDRLTKLGRGIDGAASQVGRFSHGAMGRRMVDLLERIHEEVESIGREVEETMLHGPGEEQLPDAGTPIYDALVAAHAS